MGGTVSSLLPTHARALRKDLPCTVNHQESTSQCSHNLLPLVIAGTREGHGCGQGIKATTASRLLLANLPAGPWRQPLSLPDSPRWCLPALASRPDRTVRGCRARKPRKLTAKNGHRKKGEQGEEQQYMPVTAHVSKCWA